MAEVRLQSPENPYPELRRLKPMELEGVLTPEDFFVLDPHLRPSGHRKLARTFAQVLDREVSGDAVPPV